MRARLHVVMLALAALLLSSPAAPAAEAWAGQRIELRADKSPSGYRSTASHTSA